MLRARKTARWPHLEPAQLIGPQAKYFWNMWEYLWEVAKPGSYQLFSRAISTSGRIHPIQYDALSGGHLIHHGRPVNVRVEARQHVQPSGGTWRRCCTT